jgi:hypothetical protein
MVRCYAVLLAATVVWACSPFTPAVTTVEPGVLAVETARDVTLEVLDCAGKARS